MLRSLIVSAAAAAALLAAGCGSSKEDKAATVEDLLAQFEAAYQAKDAAAITDLCAYPFEVDGAAVGTPAALQAFLQATFDAAGDYQTVELIDREITQDGDRVTVTGTFHVVDTIQGESSRPVMISGLRVQGVWKANAFSRGM